MRDPDKNSGDAKVNRYLPIGNDVAKRACRTMIKVIAFVPIKENKKYIIVDY